MRLYEHIRRVKKSMRTIKPGDTLKDLYVEFLVVKVEDCNWCKEDMVHTASHGMCQLITTIVTHTDGREYAPRYLFTSQTNPSCIMTSLLHLKGERDEDQETNASL